MFWQASAACASCGASVLVRPWPAGCALTVGDRSETENLRPVLGRLGEFSDLFLARSETSLWSPTFSDPFWPTSDPSIATHSTRTRNLEPQADKPRPRVVPLSQPQISKLLKTTCPVQCGPRVLVHFLRRQDFLDRALQMAVAKYVCAF